MAGIDNTYVSSVEELIEVSEWCNKAKFICPNGIEISFGHYEYSDEELEEFKEHFAKGREYPILNTSQTEDYFLIKHCPVKVIRDRMNEVYPEDYVADILNGESMFDTFERPVGGKHVRFIVKPEKNYFKRGYVDVEVKLPECYEDYAWYNEDYDMWILPYELGYHTSSDAYIKCKSLKALIRRIKKWNLPVGTKVTFYEYFNRQYSLIVTQ